MCITSNTLKKKTKSGKMFSKVVHIVDKTFIICVVVCFSMCSLFTIQNLDHHSEAVMQKQN